MAFAIWVTGLPASGKSTVAQATRAALQQRGVSAALLESDALRRVLTPQPTYSPEERDHFYEILVFIGTLLVTHGVPVIFDATANRRRHRQRARDRIEHYLEVYVKTPLEVCRSRDPKGIYRKAEEEEASTVPGFQEEYEPPEHPAVVVRGDRDSPENAAQQILEVLGRKKYL